MTDKAPVTVEQGDWLVRQLEAWPTRVDERFTTSITYLMQEAAKEIRRLQSIASLEEEIKRLREALRDHNEALRSAYQVADREGKDTNWLALRGNIMWALAEHQQIVNDARTALEGRGS